MTKSKLQIEKEALAYLTKVSKHLYKTTTGHYYTISLFEHEGKHCYATIHFTKDRILINTRDVVSDRQFAYYGNNTLSVLKSSLFQNPSVESIPFFKKMRALVNDIKPEIKVDSKANEVLGEKFKGRLLDLEQVKQ